MFVAVLSYFVARFLYVDPLERSLSLESKRFPKPPPKARSVKPVIRVHGQMSEVMKETQTYGQKVQ